RIRVEVMPPSDGFLHQRAFDHGHATGTSVYPDGAAFAKSAKRRTTPPSRSASGRTTVSPMRRTRSPSRDARDATLPDKDVVKSIPAIVGRVASVSMAGTSPCKAAKRAGSVMDQAPLAVATLAPPLPVGW